MAISFEGKHVAITGASGTMGRALLNELSKHGARLTALTTSPNCSFDSDVACKLWQPGQEADLQFFLAKVDVLIINHGVNVHGQYSPEAVQKSLEVNALSGWQLMELFLSTVQADGSQAQREVWINTSEAEVGPAFSPLYEISKRLMGKLITLRRLTAPCVIRKLILGPFKSNLNPIGVMSAGWVAWAIVTLARRNVRNIIVTINPLTYVAFPLNEWSHSIYFRLLCRK